MKKAILGCALVSAMFALPASAATIVFDNTSPQNTTALTGFATSGDQMTGMALVAALAGGPDGATWATTGAGCGAAAGSGWSLSECGDTFASDWTLTSGVALTSLFIDAGAGNAVFDTTFGGSTGTAGSALGTTFSTTSTLGITATYSGPVGLDGDAPLNDLYRYLRLSFDSPFSGTLTFRQDADNLLTPGDIGPTPVPEPTTMVLLGTGLVGAAVRRRRARRAL